MWKKFIAIVNQLRNISNEHDDQIVHQTQNELSVQFIYKCFINKVSYNYNILFYIGNWGYVVSGKLHDNPKSN